MQINGFDLQKVSASYHTEEKTEAKELLKLFHNEFCKAFNTECVDDLIDSGEDFIHLPAVIKSRETGDICIGFVEVDIDSSGEHWGTNFLFDRGFVSHNDTLDTNPMVLQRQAFGVYDYWYTPDYYGDIHSDKSTAPKDVREMLEYAREQRQSVNIDEFKEHSLTLRGEKRDMLDFVNAVRESNTDGTLSDLAYIRKLKPLENVLLMGFEKGDYNKMKMAGVSDAQIYKQTGNSIVVNVLAVVYEKLYQAMPYLFADIRLGSFFSGIGAFEKALDKLKI